MERLPLEIPPSYIIFETVRSKNTGVIQCFWSLLAILTGVLGDTYVDILTTNCFWHIGIE